MSNETSSRFSAGLYELSGFKLYFKLTREKNTIPNRHWWSLQDWCG